jgi:hypothetical protein
VFVSNVFEPILKGGAHKGVLPERALALLTLDCPGKTGGRYASLFCRSIGDEEKSFMILKPEIPEESSIRPTWPKI